MSPKKTYTADAKADMIIAALEDRKAVDPEKIEVRGRTLVTDFLVIASGTSRIHMRALADGVIEKLADNGMKNKRVAGFEEAVWILLDYGDVVVHILTPEQRQFYRLEAYWTGAEKGSPPLLSPEEG